MKIRIVLDGLRGESSIAERCGREGIAESLYYAWSKEFLEAGKRRLAGDPDGPAQRAGAQRLCALALIRSAAHARYRSGCGLEATGDGNEPVWAGPDS